MGYWAARGLLRYYHFWWMDRCNAYIQSFSATYPKVHWLISLLNLLNFKHPIIQIPQISFHPNVFSRTLRIPFPQMCHFDIYQQKSFECYRLLLWKSLLCVVTFEVIYSYECDLGCGFTVWKEAFVFYFLSLKKNYKVAPVACAVHYLLSCLCATAH